jgi:hypothetical protein
MFRYLLFRLILGGMGGNNLVELSEEQEGPDPFSHGADKSSISSDHD